MDAAETSGEPNTAEGLANASSQQGDKALLAAGASSDGSEKRDTEAEEVLGSSLPASEGGIRSNPVGQSASSLQQDGDAAEPGGRVALPEEQASKQEASPDAAGLGLAGELSAQSSAATASAEGPLPEGPASDGPAGEPGRPGVLAPDALQPSIGGAEEAAAPTTEGTTAEKQGEQLLAQASSVAVQLDAAGNQGEEQPEATGVEGAEADGALESSLVAAAAAAATPIGSMQQRELEQPDVAALLPPTLAFFPVPEPAAAHASGSSTAVPSKLIPLQDESRPALSEAAVSEAALSKAASEPLQMPTAVKLPVTEAVCPAAAPPTIPAREPTPALAVAVTASQVQAEYTAAASADPGGGQPGAPAQQEAHWGSTDTAMPPLEPGFASMGGLDRCSEGVESTSVPNGEPTAVPKEEATALPNGVPGPAAEADAAVAGEATASAASIVGAEAVPAVEAGYSELPACQQGTDAAASIVAVRASTPLPAYSTVTAEAASAASAASFCPSWHLSSEQTAGAAGTNALGAASEAEPEAKVAASETVAGAAVTPGGLNLLSYVHPMTGSQAGEETCAPSVASWQHASGFEPSQSACASVSPQPFRQPNSFQHEEQQGSMEGAYATTLLPQQEPDWGSDHELLSPMSLIQEQQWPERNGQQQPQQQEQQLPSLQRAAISSSSESSSAVRLRTADAAALTVHCASQERRLVVPAFPVERLQTAMGSGLSAMRDRLKTAVERESHLRFETEMAAVDREELLQARALAEANAEVDRQARQQAELELQRLSSSLEEERRRSQLEAVQLQGELKASHAAIRALEKQVVGLQADLNAEVQRRQAAEQQLERRMLQQSRANLRQGMLQAPAGSSHKALPQLPSALPSVQPHSEQSPSKLPFLGRLQTEHSTPHRPSRTPRPLLQDVKQWLQSKQQEAAPWGPPPSIPSPPRSRTGSFRQHSAAGQAQEAVLAQQQPHRQQQQQQEEEASPAVPWHQQQQEQQAGPAARWEQPQRAPPSMPAPHEAQGYPPVQPAPAPASRSRLWQRQDPSGSPTASSASASEPGSPSYQQQASVSGRRRQGGGSSAWTFKPAWNDGWGSSSPSPRAAAGRGSACGRVCTAGPSRGPVDQVLSDLTEGLEQLRRSYSPPGSPYHTTSTLPARGPPQLHSHAPPQQAQQHYMAQPPVMQPTAGAQQQGGWGFPTAPAAPMAAPPAYGFETRPITSLLMPSLPSPAAPATSQGSGGAPIIQYISSYHSPNSGGGQPVAGGDTGGRPPTSAVLSMPQQPLWVQHPVAANAVHSLPIYQNHYALPPQVQVAPPQQAMPIQQQVLLPVLEQRPHTPAVGLAPSAAPVPASYVATAANQQQPQQQQPDGFAAAPPGIPAAGLPSRHTTGGGRFPGTARPPYTARPRSPGRNKDKPLAVPPQQMDESALEAARVQYMLDKHLIRAKRMRELAESPDFSLGTG